MTGRRADDQQRLKTGERAPRRAARERYPMKQRTTVVKTDPHHPDPGDIREAALCLRRGGLVAFPTETVYGLGADATNGKAVAAVFEVKGRPPDNPLIVHVASLEDARALVTGVGEAATALMEAFWPGPLSLVLPRSDLVVPAVSCGLDTVAIRMPAHPVALELLRQAGVPVAAPSANVSGRPSPTRAEHVLADLGGRVDFVLDGGPCPVGVESTVLDLTGPVPVLLRPGGVTVEDLRKVVGEVLVTPRGEPPVARSPGLRYRHYAPRAFLHLVLPGAEGPGSRRVAEVVARAAAAEAAAGRTVGVACTRETAGFLESLRAGTPGLDGPRGMVIRTWGSRDTASDTAARLFAVLRELDRHDVDVILAEGLSPAGLGLAVNDRLLRAARAVTGPVEEAEAEETRPETILLVCSGNTCRSPMAMVLLADRLRRLGAGDRFRIESAGTSTVEGLPASPEAVRLMAEKGLDLSGHRSRLLTEDLVARARLILMMTRRLREMVLEDHPGAADRVFTVKGYAGTAGTAEEEDVEDPIGRGLEAYRRAAEELERASEIIAERLLDPLDFRHLLGEEHGESGTDVQNGIDAGESTAGRGSGTGGPDEAEGGAG